MLSKKLQVIKDDIFIYDSMPDETILCEDMYQAACASYAIDCGWYENDEDGNFITYFIKDCDWENPIIKIFTRNITDAKWSINVCKEYLDNMPTG